MAEAAGLIIGSVISAAVSHRNSQKQQAMAREAEDKAMMARAEEEARALQIAQDTRPDTPSVAEGIKFGSRDNDTGAFSDFLVPKKLKQKGSSVKTSGTAGLGFV